MDFVPKTVAEEVVVVEVAFGKGFIAVDNRF